MISIRLEDGTFYDGTAALNTYAKRALVKMPSLGDYEQRAAAKVEAAGVR